MPNNFGSDWIPVQGGKMDLSPADQDPFFHRRRRRCRRCRRHRRRRRRRRRHRRRISKNLRRRSSHFWAFFFDGGAPACPNIHRVENLKYLEQGCGASWLGPGPDLVPVAWPGVPAIGILNMFT